MLRHGDLVQKYDQQGYAIVRNVIDQDLVREAQNHINWLLEKNPGSSPELLSWNADDPFWLRLVKDDRLLDVAEPFIGPDIALFASAYIAKPPQSGKIVSWHQDGSFWPLEPMRVVSLWLSLDDVRPDNGCMRVIPETQNLDLQGMVQSEAENILGQEISAEFVDESKAVDIILGPGDVSIHNPNIIHGSNANTSDRWRRGLTIRYIPTSTKITAEPWPGTFLLRGKIVPGVNDYSPAPQFDRERHMPFRGCESANLADKGKESWLKRPFERIASAIRRM